MKYLHMITFLLLIIGGINWLILGVASWDVSALFGGQTATVSRFIYVIIGLAAIYEIVTHKDCCKKCAPPKKAEPAPTQQEQGQ